MAPGSGPCQAAEPPPCPVSTRDYEALPQRVCFPSEVAQSCYSLCNDHNGKHNRSLQALYQQGKEGESRLLVWVPHAWPGHGQTPCGHVLCGPGHSGQGAKIQSPWRPADWRLPRTGACCTCRGTNTIPLAISSPPSPSSAITWESGTAPASAATLGFEVGSAVWGAVKRVTV